MIDDLKKKLSSITGYKASDIFLVKVRYIMILHEH